MEFQAKVSMAPTDMKPWPEFIQKRIEMWDRLMAEYKTEIAQKVMLHFLDFFLRHLCMRRGRKMQCVLPGANQGASHATSD